MQIKDKTSFQSGRFYNISTRVQENPLLNRGILDLGGIGIPQAAMSNNKTEAVERGVMSALYFAASFLTPFVMLPFFNKRFLRPTEIVKNFKSNEILIMEVPKKYLTKGADYLIDGIRETAQIIKNDKLRKTKVDPTKDFENIIECFKNDKDGLYNKLVKVHEKVLKWDFLATGAMWASIPWVITESSKIFTKRDDFSAIHKMKTEEKVDEEKLKKDKLKRFALTTALAIVPAILVSKAVTKGITSKSNNIIKKYANNFNYKYGKFMSKTLFASMWALVDYPAVLISARDRHERKDRSIRYGGMVVAFFAVDPLVNNVLGRLSDVTLGTNVMGKHDIKGLRQINEIKDVSRLTKISGVGIYWAGMLAAIAALGFGLPIFLNAMLKKDISKENAQQAPNFPVDKRGFKKLGF